MAINPISSGVTLQPDTGAAGRGATAGGFFDVVARLAESTAEANTDANEAISGMLEGSTDVHDAMIALQRADLTLQFTVQVRNKLVQAYQEIMRMPV